MPQKIEVDTSQALTAVSQYVDMLKKLNLINEDLIKSTVDVTKVGQKYQAVVKGITADNKALSASFRGDLVNGINLQKASIREVTSELAKQKQAEREAAEAAKKAKKEAADAARAAATAQREFNKAVRDAQKESASTRIQLLDVNTFQRIAQAQAFKQVFNSIANEITQATTAAANFQVKISEIRTLSQQNQLSFNRWATEIQAVSDQLGLPIADVAQAAYEALSNQVTKGADAFEFLRKSGEFALVTQSTLAQAVDLTTSALNAYGLSVENTDRVQAIFFKTIDLGRIKTEEISDTFGVVAVTAASLGVSLEEVNAALATLTIQGIKPANAITFLTNVFNKLIKPTEEMQKLLDSFGTSTGQAAIAAFGFEGVLQKLAEATNGSAKELSELFNEIRGFKGAQLVTPNLFAGFQSNLEQIRNSAQSFDLAKTIINESSGRQFQIELNKIKNFFINTFGTGIIDTIDTLTSKFGGLANVVEFVTKTTLVSGASYLAYRAATAQTTVVVNAASTAFTGLGAAQQVANVNTIKLTLSSITLTGTLNTLKVAAVGAIAGLVGGAGIGLAVAAFEKFNREAEKTEAVLKRIDERRTKQAENQFQFTPQNDAQRNVDAANQLTQIGQIISLSISRDIADVNKRLVDSIANMKRLKDSINISFNSLLDQAQVKLADINTRLKDSIDVARESFKSFTDFRQSLSKTLFDEALGANGPEQQIQLIRSRIADLFSEIRSLQATNTKDSINEARQRFTEIAQLTKSLFDKGAVPGGVRGLEGEFSDLAQKRLNFERQIIAAQTIQQKNLEKQRDSEEQRVKALRQAINDLTDFSVLSDKGTLSDKFKDNLGRFDATKAASEFANIQKRLLDLSKDADQSLAVFNNIKQLEFTIFKQIEDEKLKSQRESEQQRVINFTNNNKRLIEEAQKAKNELLQIFRDTTPDKNPALDLEAQAREFEKLTRRFAANEGDPRGTPEDRVKLLKDIQNIQTVIQNVRKDLAGGPIDPERLKQVDEQYKSIFARLNELSPNIVKGDVLKVIEGIGFNIDLIIQKNTELNNVVNNLAQLRDLPAQLNANLDPKTIKLFFDSLSTDATTATAQVSSAFINTVNPSIDSTISKIDILNRKLTDLTQKSFTVNLNLTGNPFGGGGGPIIGFASGGIVGGKPGIDKNLAWLTRGEAIIDAERTRQYMPIIQAIQSAPKFAVGGINNVQNVGDINISVNESRSPKSTAREVANQFRRELRRNTTQL